MEQTQAAATKLKAFLLDIAPREAKGLVMTTHRSTAITIRVIMLQIPNRAPQKAYSSQPAGKQTQERGDVEKKKKCTKHAHLETFFKASNLLYVAIFTTRCRKDTIIDFLLQHLPSSNLLTDITVINIFCTTFTYYLKYIQFN